MLPLAALADVENILDHIFQAEGFFVQNFDVILYMVGKRLLLFQQIYVADNRGKRRLNVMGNVGDELHLHALALYTFLHSGVYAVLNIV